MTKQVRAVLDQLVTQRDEGRALRWSDPDPLSLLPDVPVPVRDDYTEGWTFNFYTEHVFKAWSSSIYHGNDWPSENPESRPNASQRPASLYSTKVKALRRAMEADYARKLAAIDAQIAEEATCARP